MIVPLFGIGNAGKSKTVTAQRRINFYGEVQPEQDKTKFALFGTPGTELFSSAFGDTPHRGAYAVGDLLYSVHRGTFYETNNAGVRTSRGTINTTTGRVDISYNGTVLLIVDGTAGYTYNIGTTTLTQIADADLPNGATTCTWLGGYFIVESNNQYYVSADGIAWDALDHASAEVFPDDIVRVFANDGVLILFGGYSTEYASNTGGADFPFSPIGSAGQEYGLAAKWSLAKFAASLIGLFKNRLGQVQVMQMNGMQYSVVSNPELDALINGYSSVSDATGFSYMLGGHPMYQLNFPSELKSWLYDGLTMMWSEKQYGLSGARDRGEMCVDFINKPRVFDYSNGNIYNLDADLYTDNGTQILSRVVTRHFFNDYKVVIVDRIYIDFETGVGLASGQGSDPQAMLRVSRDGGRTFGNEMWRTIGAVGEYTTRVEWTSLGAARDWVFDLSIADPVKRVIANAAIDYTPGSR